jgi:nucleoside-diphosphate-sugar epimerase
LQDLLRRFMRVLLVGFGDVAQRLAKLSLAHRFDLIGVSRSVSLLKAGMQHVRFVVADLDDARSLARLGGLADVVVMLAPPVNSGADDMRSRRLAAALSRGWLPQRMIYVSTTGVYGDCSALGWIDETQPVNAQSDRAKRRVAAEEIWRAWARRNCVRLSILRVPGIYAESRLPIDRLKAGTPAFLAEEDGYSNHIHADDLATIIVRAATSLAARGGRVFNTVDESDMKMGEYFDAVADALKLPRPPRKSRAQVRASVSVMQWSFMQESRRIVAGSDGRLARELKVQLLHPNVMGFLKRVAR